MVTEVAAEYPDVTLDHLHVDAASFALMLEHAFRRRQMARAVESAAVAALRELRTPDVGGHATTEQVTEAVLRHLSWSRWSPDPEEEPVGAEWGV